MGRKAKPEPISQPSAEPADPTIAEIWDEYEPGSRISKGIYSIWKTAEGGMHIAYRPEDAEEDAHLPIPAAMVQMMIAASQGKGPFGRLQALAMARFGG